MKNLWLFLPTQLLNHTQWWSIRYIHWLHSLQCLTLGRLILWHFSHHFVSSTLNLYSKDLLISLISTRKSIHFAQMGSFILPTWVRPFLSVRPLCGFWDLVLRAIITMILSTTIRTWYFLDFIQIVKCYRIAWIGPSGLLITHYHHKQHQNE